MPSTTSLCVSATAVVLVVTQLTLSSASKSQHSCGESEYYDSGTGSCEPCYDICLYAAYYKTVQECKDNCPDYDAKNDCKQDEYFDDVVHSCTSCSEICDHHTLTDSTAQCYEKCKDYIEKKPPEVVSNRKSDALKASATLDGDSSKLSSEDPSSTSSFTLANPGWVTALALGILCFILVIVVIAQLLKNRSSYNPVNKEDIEPGAVPDHPQTPARPVEETSSNGSDHFAFPGCQRVAFSELSRDQEC